MSMNVGPAKVVLTEFDGRGVSCDAFENRLGLVKAVIDNGGISVSRSYYGSPEHLAALDEVEKQIAETRRKIAEQKDECTSPSETESNTNTTQDK